MANRNVEHAVRIALLAASAASVGVYAQGAFAQENELEQIIVTGSRIPQPNLEGTSPVSVIGAQEVALQGVTQVEDLINNLPQAFADQGGNISNGATGTATVNLRNLGADRTLVLVNGRRLPVGTPAAGGGSAADLNQIPAPLIERVEVLTGGASAVYGSDAVAGVVNFIMKTDFEGVQFDANTSFYNHKNDNDVADVVKARGFDLPGKYIGSDGDTTALSLLLGSNFADGRGNATVFIGYRKVDALLQSERDYSSCALGSNANGFTCGGSSTSFPGRFFSNNADGSDIYGTNPLEDEGIPCGPYIDENGEPAVNNCFPNAPARPNAALQDILANNGFTIADANGATRPFTASDIYNYGPLNYYQRPDETYSFSSFAHYDINDSATIYTELSFHDNRTVAQIAPSGLFGLIADIDCNNNPLLSAQQVNELCTAPTTYVPELNPDGSINYNGVGQHVSAITDGIASTFILRRNIEGGGRQDDLRNTSYRGVVGVKGTILDNWNYDVSGQYGTVVFAEMYLNDFSRVRSARAMDVIADDDGNPVCRSVVDGSDPNCVPYNIWSLNGVTPEALAYLQTPGFQEGNTQQKVVTATMASDLGAYGIKTPWSNSGIGIALGAEYREESLTLRTDQAFSTGDLFGQGGPQGSVDGGYNLKDFFVETRIPIAEGLFMAEQLGLNASYRYSDYSTGVTTDTYGIGLDWAPISSLKLRGSYQRAVRAPNVKELFDPQNLGLYDNDADPCAGTAPTATLAQCANTGVTSEQYGTILDNPAGQYNALFGGNPDLDPETSDSYTVGFVFTPSFVDGLSVTIDYFNIKVEDVISTIPPTTTLRNCLDTGDPAFCNLISRDGLGTLWALPEAQIVATNANLATWETSGVDLDVNYAMEVGAYGSMTMNLIGTYLDEFLQEPLKDQGEYDCAGLYGSGTCGTPLPEWRHKARVTWSTPWNLDLSLQWRYIDSVLFEKTSDNPLLRGDGVVRSVDRELDAQNYIDVTGSYTFLEGYTFRMGVNNVTDEDPPLSAQVGSGFGNGNTFPQVYDAFGRYVFIGLTAKF